jgi:hypothetical protein
MNSITRNHFNKNINFDKEKITFKRCKAQEKDGERPSRCFGVGIEGVKLSKAPGDVIAEAEVDIEV